MSRVEPPPLADEDVFVYLHGNGAITLLAADHKSRFVPLAEAIDAARGRAAAGGTVYLGTDGTGLATAAQEAVDTLDVEVTPYDCPPPYGWDDGTNALMSAAAFGRDAILDDLIERGADVLATDDFGANALHHAVGAGNIHAIEALVLAGADVEKANGKGFTPYALAMACGHPAAAERLAALGARPSVGATTEVEFRRSHYGTMVIWPILALLALGLVAPFLWPFSLRDLAILGLIVAGYILVSPPRAFWAGGVPRTLDGEILTIRRVTGRTVRIDLNDVYYGASGLSIARPPYRSSNRSAPWLLLAHPDGHPIGRRRTFRALRVPSHAEIDEVSARSDRYVVVVLDGMRCHEVVLPVGNVLTASGVDLSPSFRQVLERARAAAARKP